MPRGAVAEPFEDCFKVNESSGCWEWQKYLTGCGYGKRGHAGKVYLAHRFSWLKYKGPIPSGLHVLHRCDNPCCVNPDHLFLGTHQDNMKNRQQHLVGSLNGRAKLTVEQVLAIRADKRLLREVAKDFGIGVSRVHEIRVRKTWKHL